MGEILTLNPEEERQHIATTYIDFVRHGNRYPGQIKVTINGEEKVFDDPDTITSEGWNVSREFGTAYPPHADLIHPRGTTLIRTGETGEAILEGAFTTNPQSVQGRVLNRDETRIKGARSRRGLGSKEVVKTAGHAWTGRGVDEHLQGLVDALPDKQRFIEDKEYRAKLREQAQLQFHTEFINNPDNEWFTMAAAESMACELVHDLALSRRGVKGGETKAIPVVISGLFPESLFKYALVRENMQTGEKITGFTNIDEIGGFTKHGTAFRIIAVRDDRLGDSRNIEDHKKDTRFEFSFTDPERQKLFEGQQVYLDWDEVLALAKAAGERFKKDTEQAN